MLRIYLAGPQVFRPDAVRYGQQLKEACLASGFVGLFPLDNALPDGLSPPQQAQWIYQANLALLRQADLVLACLEPFRGSEPDSGSCFELGYAAALGKPLFGYLADQASYRQRLLRLQPQLAVPGGLPQVDAEGWQLEDFHLPLNLMLSVPVRLVGADVEQALAWLARQRETGEWAVPKN